jgi:hypothetical protein
MLAGVSYLDALAADGPPPDKRERLILFGQFIGAWEPDITNHLRRRA